VWQGTSLRSQHTVLSIDPALCLRSTVQLALNLFDFCGLSCSECDLIGKDYEKHVNQCSGRDGHQFSEHRFPPGAIWLSVFCIRNSTARACELGRVEIALKSIRLAAPGQVVHDTIRALTKFGQQADACLGAVRDSNIPTLVNLPLVYLGGLGGAC
jgi:hypothetical protein